MAMMSFSDRRSFLSMLSPIRVASCTCSLPAAWLAAASEARGIPRQALIAWNTCGEEQQRAQCMWSACLSRDGDTG